MLALIGMPRSGTTWVAKAIDSHPKTYYLHEPDSVKRLSIPNIINEQDADEYRQTLSDYMNDIERVDGLKVVGRLPFYPKAYFNGAQLVFNRMSATASKGLGRFFPSLGKAAPLLIKPRGDYEVFFKSIESMGRVSALLKADPDLKVLMLVRHPCAVINSELKGEAANKFASKTPIYENWGLFEKLLFSDTAVQQGLTLEGLKAMTPAERLAWKWRIFYEQMLSQADKPHCMMIQYEELASKPQAGFEKVMAFYGLDMDPQVQQYLIDTTTSHSDAYYATSKDPAKAMHSWKQRLDEDTIQQITAIAGEHLNNEYWSA
ncbi:sulfotransferase [Aestuariibacter halophilus]|uniref:Sulfotransferase n=1 Tax=Fluctibacter halophilus TaxID=226011 RepID=A0ABS8G408_9ALTE|nr:sulfotransferase [Aestuariibacter halophilus]MCC2614861.1 sulfotransferase [Aestuariibacter halophilus]